MVGHQQDLPRIELEGGIENQQRRDSFPELQSRDWVTVSIHERVEADLMVTPYHLRVAKPVSDIERTKEMYCRGLGFRVIGRFDNHDGFDGVMLGVPGASYHFEFTFSHAHPIHPAPTVEDLVVLYVPDEQEWLALCFRMRAAGFKQVGAFNPYWDRRGRTYEDGDGYRVVLQQAEHPAGW